MLLGPLARRWIPTPTWVSRAALERALVFIKGRGPAAAALERPEDRLPLLGRDAGAGVVDAEQGPAVAGLDPDPDGRARVGVAGRVGQQVLDDPLDLGRVGHDLDGSQVQAHRVGVEQLLAGLLDYPGDQAGQVDPPAAQLDDAPVQAVQVPIALP